MEKKDKIIISIFILAYFFIVGIDVMGNCPLRSELLTYTRVPELLLGVDQSWKMFCPNPRDFNFYPYAIITFQDGSTAFYEFPRLDKMSQLNAAVRERLRKHFYDVMPWDDFSVFRPSVARYIARSYADPNNQPTQVTLCFNGVAIGRLPKINPHGKPFQWDTRNTFFVYQVSAEDLQ